MRHPLWGRNQVTAFSLNTVLVFFFSVTSWNLIKFKTLTLIPPDVIIAKLQETYGEDPFSEWNFSPGVC